MAVLVVTGLLALGASGAVGAQESPEDFVIELNDLRDSEALSEYPELDIARSQIVVEIQQGETFTDADRQRADLLLTALLAFERAYEISQSDPVASLDDADEAFAAIEQLDEAGEGTYAAFGYVALERFYELQGERIYDRSQEIDETPERIDMLSSSVHAYEQSGGSERYAEIQVERDNLRTEYDDDMERHDSLLDETDAYLDGCDTACEDVGAMMTEDPFSSFGAYEGAFDAHESAAEAERVAAEHGVADTSSDAATQREASFDALVTTAISSVVLGVVYTVILGAVGAVAFWRISKWGRDIKTAASDRIVTPLEVDDA
ncbi:hypothetical protein [Halorubrum gandharaense]